MAGASQVGGGGDRKSEFVRNVFILLVNEILTPDWNVNLIIINSLDIFFIMIEGSLIASIPWSLAALGLGSMKLLKLDWICQETK